MCRQIITAIHVVVLICGRQLFNLSVGQFVKPSYGCFHSWFSDAKFVRNA
jgi:hypothetical protein